MALLANELLVIIGKALQKLGEQLSDGNFDAKEQAELFQQLLTDLLREYYD